MGNRSRDSKCTVGQFTTKTPTTKKRITPIYFSTNYRREIKLIPINMDYCLFQYDALKFFFGVRLHGGLYLTEVDTNP